MKENPRKGFLYWSDDGDLMALRYENWKLHFMEQRAHGMSVWQEPFVPLRVPKIFNLRSDPFERGRRRRDHVLPEVGCRPRVPAGAGPGYRRRIPQDVPGVPATPDGRVASASTRHWRKPGGPRSSWQTVTGGGVK